MPESGAIERTRDAMDVWLHQDLPADFDQLRADLQHILGCIPVTHQRPPSPNGYTAEHCGMGCHITYQCAHCQWQLETGVNPGPPGPLHDRLTEHAATHQEPPC